MGLGVMQPLGDIGQEEGQGSDSVEPSRGSACIEEGEEEYRSHDETYATVLVVQPVPDAPGKGVLGS